ncbi:MAG: Holliday junction branch migration protein RuvA [Patescibacteria group bacterium]
MFSYLEGKIKEKSHNRAILETSGIGWEVFISEQTFKKLPAKDKKAKLFVFLQQKSQEGVFEVYGFLTQEEKELFLLLTSVDKIGPRIALNILSSAPIDKIKSAIQLGKTEFLNKIIGVGEKTASRIVFELSKKIRSGRIEPGLFDLDLEVEEALLVMGFSLKQAKKAIAELGDKPVKVSERIAVALKILSGKTKG